MVLARDEQFFDQFQESADNASEVPKVLIDVVSNGPDRRATFICSGIWSIVAMRSRTASSAR